MRYIDKSKNLLYKTQVSNKQYACMYACMYAWLLTLLKIKNYARVCVLVYPHMYVWHFLARPVPDLVSIMHTKHTYIHTLRLPIFV